MAGRKNLGKSCTADELDEMKLIRNHVTCAEQALNPRNLPDCEENTPQAKKMAVYVKAAIAAKAEGMFLEERWWRQMMAKYQMGDPAVEQVFVDFADGSFYKNEG